MFLVSRDRTSFEPEPVSFWELKPITNNDQWNYCYKFQTEADLSNCDINLYFTADKNYTHEVIVK